MTDQVANALRRALAAHDKRRQHEREMEQRRSAHQAQRDAYRAENHRDSERLVQLWADEEQKEANARSIHFSCNGFINDCFVSETGTGDFDWDR
jgi:hypothetical protein